jgi:hypothetical protein
VGDGDGCDESEEDTARMFSGIITTVIEKVKISAKNNDRK